jgi:hypothetical protein
MPPNFEITLTLNYLLKPAKRRAQGYAVKKLNESTGIQLRLLALCSDTLVLYSPSLDMLR